jgi:hypothetical protein
MTRKRKQKKRDDQRLETQKRSGRIAHGMVIPEGAIPADLEKQAPNNTYSPLLYYVDQPFTCVDCGSEEVWTATQQKWYYEVAKGPIYARAIRCRPCRTRFREQKGLSRVKKPPAPQL